MEYPWAPPKIKVIFENYTVTHTNGITYTRVRGKGILVWIPIGLLPQNPEYDHEYFIDEKEFYYHERVGRERSTRR